MSELAFLSVDDASRAASPLARSLRGAEGIGDLSLLGKLEVRGDIAAIEGDVIRITSERALVVCDLDDVAALRTALRGTVVDVTSALAGIEVEGEPLMRRVTDLALDRLPAAGKVADVPAVVTRQDERFRIFFPQEFGDSVVATVRDAQEGLR